MAVYGFDQSGMTRAVRAIRNDERAGTDTVGARKGIAAPSPWFWAQLGEEDTFQSGNYQWKKMTEGQAGATAGTLIPWTPTIDSGDDADAYTACEANLTSGIKGKTNVLLKFCGYTDDGIPQYMFNYQNSSQFWALLTSYASASGTCKFTYGWQLCERTLSGFANKSKTGTGAMNLWDNGDAQPDPEDLIGRHVLMNVDTDSNDPDKTPIYTFVSTPITLSLGFDTDGSLNMTTHNVTNLAVDINDFNIQSYAGEVGGSGCTNNASIEWAGFEVRHGTAMPGGTISDFYNDHNKIIDFVEDYVSGGGVPSGSTTYPVHTTITQDTVTRHAGTGTLPVNRAIVKQKVNVVNDFTGCDGVVTHGVTAATFPTMSLSSATTGTVTAVPIEATYAQPLTHTAATGCTGPTVGINLAGDVKWIEYVPGATGTFKHIGPDYNVSSTITPIGAPTVSSNNLMLPYNVTAVDAKGHTISQGTGGTYTVALPTSTVTTPSTTVVGDTTWISVAMAGATATVSHVGPSSTPTTTVLPVTSVGVSSGTLNIATLGPTFDAKGHQNGTATATASCSLPGGITAVTGDTWVTGSIAAGALAMSHTGPGAATSTSVPITSLTESGGVLTANINSVTFDAKGHQVGTTTGTASCTIAGLITSVAGDAWVSGSVAGNAIAVTHTGPSGATSSVVPVTTMGVSSNILTLNQNVPIFDAHGHKTGTTTATATCTIPAAGITAVTGDLTWISTSTTSGTATISHSGPGSPTNTIMPVTTVSYSGSTLTINTVGALFDAHGHKTGTTTATATCTIPTGTTTGYSGTKTVLSGSGYSGTSIVYTTSVDTYVNGVLTTSTSGSTITLAGTSCM